jgi:hypothetical protein
MVVLKGDNNEETDVDGKITLKLILKKHDMRC